MQLKVYDELPDEAKNIRKKVFIMEQGFEDEFDEIDKIATHIVIFDGFNAVGTCRFFFSEKKGCYVIGRIAVNKDYRGKKCGAKLLTCAENEIKKRGACLVGLSAQSRVAEFYKKQGYEPVGDIYLDEGCPHIWMKKEL